jgi:hypothetical protein
MDYPLTQAEQDREWNSPATLRMRALDKTKHELDQRMRALDQQEADAKAATVRAKQLAAPPTPEEAAEIESRRVVGWVTKNLAPGGIDDLLGITDSQFRAALVNVPKAEFADGRTLQEHVITLRIAEPEPYVEPEPELGKPGTLAALLGKVN